jgi:hypothetical protein
MSAIPPSLSVTVNTARRACIIDMPLALSPYGLLLTQRLSDEFNVWLVRELWQILDSPEHFQEHPELLLPLQSKSHVHQFRIKIRKNFIRQTLEQWQLVRMQSDLGRMKVYWLNDAIGDSLLPQDTDPHVIERFEALAMSLENRGASEKRTEIQAYDASSECHLEAAALSAALIPYKSFVLTENGGKASEGEPALCTFLRKRGIGCIHLDSPEATQTERNLFYPTMARAGLSELFWAGLNLAAVHLFVPRAIVMAIPNSDDPTQINEDFQLEGREPTDPPDWWGEAKCFWYELNP